MNISRIIGQPATVRVISVQQFEDGTSRALVSPRLGSRGGVFATRDDYLLDFAQGSDIADLRGESLEIHDNTRLFHRGKLIATGEGGGEGVFNLVS